jgi:hypothetical protein
MRRLACLSLLVSLIALAAACAGPSRPAEDESTMAACAEAPDVTCDNGHPLCFVDDERACRVCRCSAFAMIPTSVPPPTNPGFMMQPTPPNLH